LEAVHDLGPFKTLFPDAPEGRKRMHEAEEKYPPVTHPVIRVHPMTGKKALFVNPQFTISIEGMEKDESDAILGLLYRKTLRHEYHYRHHWQPDMVVFWDNRWLRHSALHDYYPQRRLMERVTIRGDRPIGDAPPADPSELRRYLMPPVVAFNATRQKRQHEG
jgi:taurine dioxygenase